MTKSDPFQIIWKFLWELERNLTENNKSHKEETMKESFDIPTDYRVIITMTGICIMIINIPVVISSGLILKKGQLPKNTFILLGNISLSDMTIGFMLSFSQLFHQFSQGSSKIRCYIAIGVIITSMVTSVSCVHLIAIDRYLYIVHGMKYKTWVLPNRVRRAIVASWFWGLFHALLTIIYSNESDSCLDCLYLKMTPSKIIIFTATSELLFILITICLYAKILYHAMKRGKDLKKMDLGKHLEKNNNMRAFRGGRSLNASPQENSSCDATKEGKSVFYISFKDSQGALSQEKGCNNTKRATKIIFFTAGGFMITWFPYYVLALMYLFCDPNQNQEKCQRLLYVTYYPLTIVGLLNCGLNPMIYAWWNKGFRKSVKKMWTSMNLRYSKILHIK